MTKFHEMHSIDFQDDHRPKEEKHQHHPQAKNRLINRLLIET